MVERTREAACAAVGAGWEVPGSDWEALVANSRYGLPPDPSRDLVPLIEDVPRGSMRVEVSRALDRVHDGCFQREGGWQALRDTLSAIVERPLTAHMLFTTLMEVGTPSAARLAGVIATARARITTDRWAPTREREFAAVAIPQHYQMLFHFRRNDPVASACTQLELAHELLRHSADREPAVLVVAGECLIGAEAQLSEVTDYHRELVLRYHLALAQTVHGLASGIDVPTARITELSRLAGYTDRPELAYTARMLAATIAFRAGDPQRSAIFLDLATGMRAATDLAPSSRHDGAIPYTVVRYSHDVATEVELALTFNRRDIAIDSVAAMVQHAHQPEVWRGHELVERIDDPGLRLLIDQRVIEVTERVDFLAGRGLDGVAQWQHALVDALSYGIDSARNAGQHDLAVQWRNRRDEVLREFNRDVQRGIG